MTKLGLQVAAAAASLVGKRIIPLLVVVVLACSNGVVTVTALIHPQQYYQKKSYSSFHLSPMGTRSGQHFYPQLQNPQQQQRCLLLPTSQRSTSSSSSRSSTTTTTQLSAVLDIIGTSPEPIHTAFTIATFLPQPFWLLLILFPKSDVTKKLMGGLELVLLCSVLHFFIVGTSIVQPDGTGPLAEFNDVFDPTGNPQAAFMNMVTNYPNFVAEEWSHVLTWDFFVGRWIWLDGLQRGVFTGHSVLFCNLIGPPGLLLHAITCGITGKGLIGYDNKDE